MTVTLALGALLTVPGCLIPEASEFSPPQQTPPFIVDSSLDPEAYRILSVSQSRTRTVSFDVLSEDAGDPLVAALRLDFNAGGFHISDQEYAPSTLSAGKRQINMTLQTRNIPVGCHVLTLLLMHKSNYDTETDLPKNDRAWDDVALVNWVMSVNSPDMDTNPSLSDCPVPGEIGVTNAGAP